MPKSQVKVTVPKFNKKKSSTRGAYAAPVGKKPAHLIKDELKVLEEDLRNEATLHQPKRTLIGDKEKQRYATLLEWNGNPPPQLPPDWKPRKAKGRRTEKEELRDLFDATMSEIDERRAFMEEMRAAGKGPAVLQQIKGEIQTVSAAGRRSWLETDPQGKIFLTRPFHFCERASGTHSAEDTRLEKNRRADAECRGVRPYGPESLLLSCVCCFTTKCLYHIELNTLQHSLPSGRQLTKGA